MDSRVDEALALAVGISPFDLGALDVVYGESGGSRIAGPGAYYYFVVGVGANVGECRSESLGRRASHWSGPLAE